MKKKNKKKKRETKERCHCWGGRRKERRVYGRGKKVFLILFLL